MAFKPPTVVRTMAAAQKWRQMTVARKLFCLCRLLSPFVALWPLSPFVAFVASVVLPCRLAPCGKVKIGSRQGGGRRSYPLSDRALPGIANALRERLGGRRKAAAQRGHWVRPRGGGEWGGRRKGKGSQLSRRRGCSFRQSGIWKVLGGRVNEEVERVSRALLEQRCFARLQLTIQLRCAEAFTQRSSGCSFANSGKICVSDAKDAVWRMRSTGRRPSPPIKCSLGHICGNRRSS
jgi:hypothetical protein